MIFTSCLSQEVEKKTDSISIKYLIEKASLCEQLTYVEEYPYEFLTKPNKNHDTLLVQISKVAKMSISIPEYQHYSQKVTDKDKKEYLCHQISQIKMKKCP